MSPDREGRTELHYAAQADDVDAIATLLAAGSDPSATDRAGWTPLHFAAAEVATKAAAALLDAGANIEAEDSYGNSPLWRAVFASRGDGRLMQLLRQRGADAFHANRSGQTPVALARLIANYDVRRFFDDLPYLALRHSASRETLPFPHLQRWVSPNESVAVRNPIFTCAPH